VTEPTWEEVMTGRGMLGLDLETTSVDRTTARVVTAATVRAQPGHNPDVTTWLADPGIPIPPESTAVHGIATDHARRHGRSHADVLFEVTNKLVQAVAAGMPLVVFNAPYDLTVMENRCHAEGIMSLHQIMTEMPDMPPLYVIDPHVIDRAMDRGRRGGTGVHTLTYLCNQIYGVKLPAQDAHHAEHDATAACRLAWMMARRYPHLARLPIDELQARQAAWYAGHQTARYAGRGVDVDTHWPFTPAGGQHQLFESPAARRGGQGLL
jgi:DNA polymerase III subunit epsilon